MSNLPVSTSQDPSITLSHKEKPRLTHPILDQLHALKLMGMYHALLEQTPMSEIAELGFEERLGLLGDRESLPGRTDGSSLACTRRSSGKPPVARISTSAIHAGWTALSLRLPRLLQELPLAKGDGRYVKLMTTLAKTEVLTLDDWGLAPLSDDKRRGPLGAARRSS